MKNSSNNNRIRALAKEPGINRVSNVHLNLIQRVFISKTWRNISSILASLPKLQNKQKSRPSTMEPLMSICLWSTSLRLYTLFNEEFWEEYGSFWYNQCLRREKQEHLCKDIDGFYLPRQRSEQNHRHFITELVQHTSNVRGIEFNKAASRISIDNDSEDIPSL